MTYYHKYSNIGEYLKEEYFDTLDLEVDFVEAELSLKNLQDLLDNKRALTHRDDIMLSMYFRLSPGIFKYIDYSIKSKKEELNANI